MTSKKRLSHLPGRTWQGLIWNFACRVSALLILVLPLSGMTSSALAGEKDPVKDHEASSTRTAEGLLTTTEEMIEQLILQIDRQNENTQEKKELAEYSNPSPLYSSIPTIKPVQGSITSEFGMRMHPVHKSVLFHAGVDISASTGTEVHATGDGIVAFAGYDGGYGQKVTINHGYGYKTIYAHLSKALVREGQRIKRGEIIALSGSTGVSTGPHLHYEVQKNGVTVNPTAYFEDAADKKFMTHKNIPDYSDSNS
jgi:murein DD-endopeptidase MepM/ murein hydrolase activator NlpD